MFLRTKTKKQNGTTYTYYQLVEAYHTPQGPRQRVVASLGDLSPRPREQWLELFEQVQSVLSGQKRLDAPPPTLEARDVARRVREKRPGSGAANPAEWIAVDPARMEIREARELGPAYVGVTFWERLGLEGILRGVGLTVESARRVELMAVNALCEYESEYAMPRWMARTAIADLLGWASPTLSDSTLYRTLDELRPHREAIEKALAERERTLFALPETVVLYDLTSTYFEGAMKGNQKARRGYSRDQRPDCPQVVLGLVLDEEGFPKGHLLFDGNRRDSATLAEMVAALDRRAENAGATVVMDRGLATKANLEWLRERKRTYLVAERQGERENWIEEFLAGEWEELRRPGPPTQPEQKRTRVEIQRGQRGDECYVLCRSEGRKAKDAAIRERFTQRLERDLEKLRRRIESGRLKTPEKMHQALGRLRERYPRVARFYEMELAPVKSPGKEEEKEALRLNWKTKEDASNQAQELDGTYLLRTNRTDLSGEAIWKIYVMLTHVESAFRQLKSTLHLRPVRHHREDRGEAHIFLCVLAYHLLHAIETTLRRQGEYRLWGTIRKELRSHQLVTVTLPTQTGEVYERRQPTTAEPHQREIYRNLGMDAGVSRYPKVKRKHKT